LSFVFCPQEIKVNKSPNIKSLFIPVSCLKGLHITVCSYKKLAIITTNVDAENQCLINHKCVCGVLNRQFLVGAVICRFFLHAITKFAFSIAIPIVAIAPELNFKKSVSIPSEKISPLLGIND